MADSMAHRLTNHPPDTKHVSALLDQTDAVLLHVGLFLEQALPESREKERALDALDDARTHARNAVARNQDIARPPQAFIPGDPVVHADWGDGHVIDHRWDFDAGDWLYVVQVDDPERAPHAVEARVGDRSEKRGRQKVAGVAVARAEEMSLLVRDDADQAAGPPAKKATGKKAKS